MNKKKIEAEYKKKIKKINNLNLFYYDKCDPLVTDVEYDKLKNKKYLNCDIWESRKIEKTLMGRNVLIRPEPNNKDINKEIKKSINQDQ